MVVGVLTIDIHIPESGSLKGRRGVVKGLKDRIRSRFNVSVAEVDDEGLWQRSTLGVACVSSDKARVDEILAKVVDLVRSNTEIELLDYQVEII